MIIRPFCFPSFIPTKGYNNSTYVALDDVLRTEILLDLSYENEWGKLRAINQSLFCEWEAKRHHCTVGQKI